MFRLLSIAVVMLLLVACGGGGDDDDSSSSDTPAGTTQASGGGSTPSGSAESTATAGEDATEADAEPTQFDPNRPDVHVPLAAGSSGEVESGNPDPSAVDEDMSTVKVTIVRIIDPATPNGGFFTPSAGNRWWAVEITMANTGDKPVNTGEWTLHTTDGADYTNMYMSSVGEDILYGAIDPGETQQGVIVFEIPEIATVQWLFMDPSIYVGENLVFDAQ